MAIFKAEKYVMTRREALELFKLKEEFDREVLRMLYHRDYIMNFRQRSASVTIDETESLTTSIRLLNEAYSELSGTNPTGDESLQLDFRESDLDVVKGEIRPSEEAEFKEIIDGLLRDDKYGIALSLLESGISLSLARDSTISLKPLPDAIRMLGSILIEMGLIDQGISLKIIGLGNLARARTFYEIGEFRMAGQSFALELQEEKPERAIDMIGLDLFSCYFLQSEHESALDVIEKVLPRLMGKKFIFGGDFTSIDMALAILISIHKCAFERSSIFRGFRTRLHYPLATRFLEKTFGSLSKAFAALDDFLEKTLEEESIPFGMRIPPIVKNKIIVEYSMDTYQDIYYRMFDRPLNRSLIYHAR